MNKLLLTIGLTIISYANGDLNNSSDYLNIIYIESIVIILLLGYIIKKEKSNIVVEKDEEKKVKKRKTTKNPPKVIEKPKVIDTESIELTNIKIENQPFQLSGLLHSLTHKISPVLKENSHTLYYDTKNDIGRYIISDNNYLGYLLLVLLKNVANLQKNSEITLIMEKRKDKFLICSLINRDIRNIEKKELELLEANIVAKAMGGEISIKNGMRQDSKIVLTLPFIKDKNSVSNTKEIKKPLIGKNALFVGKSGQDRKITQYIFKNYGIKIQNMELEEFETKRPDITKYDMAILRSKDLTTRHIQFFKNVYDDPNSNFKIIIVHELFETKEQREKVLSIAHAEFYNPTIIGDVEEILYQLFINKSDSLIQTGSNHESELDDFKLVRERAYIKGDYDKYQGAVIIVVENNIISQRILEQILINIGVFTVITVRNGVELINELKQRDIDLIFTDINMPLMDGYSATKNIRENPRWKDIPVIAVSEMDYDQEIRKMIKIGMNIFIKKPFTKGHIYTALEKFLIPKKISKVEHIQTEIEEFSYTPNLDILDTTQGILDTDVYIDILTDTMDAIKNTERVLEIAIVDGDIVRVKRHAIAMLSFYENIHAPQILIIFRDLLLSLNSEQKVFLNDFLILYKTNQDLLDREVNKYIKYINII